MEIPKKRKSIERFYLFSDEIFPKNIGFVKKTEFNMANRMIIEKYREYFRSLHIYSLAFICREITNEKKYVADILHSGLLDDHGCYLPEVMRQIRRQTQVASLLP